jgi:hypothetical protein
MYIGKIDSLTDSDSSICSHGSHAEAEKAFCFFSGPNEPLLSPAGLKETKELLEFSKK